MVNTSGSSLCAVCRHELIMSYGMLECDSLATPVPAAGVADV